MVKFTKFGLLLSLTFFSLIASARDYTEKSSWYIGFGAGSGNGSYTDNVETTTFTEWNKGADSSLRFSFNFGVGAIITPNFNLGFDLTSIINSASANDDTYGDTSGAIGIANYFAMATIFPMEHGLLMRFGGGLSRMTVTLDTPYGDYSDEVSGYGGLVGIGYAFQLGSTFNLGINFDYSFQKYNGSTGDPEKSHFWNLYLTCYWY